MKVLALIALLCFVSVAHCEATSNSEALIKLGHAEDTWRQSAPVSYDYTVLSSGVFGGAIHRVTVRGSGCKSKWRSTGVHFQSWKRETCDDHRIDEILRELRRLLEYGAERVEVRFNATFGYVEYLSLTPGGGVPDQDWYVEMQRFVQR
jgi:Family of unknown function (DUF6174)